MQFMTQEDKRIGLLDIDETVISKDYPGQVNYHLFQKLRDNDIKDIAIFSNFSPQVDAVLKNADSQHLTRPEIITILRELNFNVICVITNYDKFYKAKKPGGFFEDGKVFYGNITEEDKAKAEAKVRSNLKDFPEEFLNDKSDMMDITLPMLVDRGYTEIFFYDDMEKNLTATAEVVAKKNQDCKTTIKFHKEIVKISENDLRKPAKQVLKDLKDKIITDPKSWNVKHPLGGERTTLFGYCPGNTKVPRHLKPVVDTLKKIDFENNTESDYNSSLIKIRDLLVKATNSGSEKLGFYNGLLKLCPDSEPFNSEMHNNIGASLRLH